MRHRFVTIGALAFLVIGRIADASTITVFGDPASFDASTSAQALTIPDATYFKVGCGSPTPGALGEGTVIQIPFASNHVTITDPVSPSGGMCIFDAGAVIPDNNTVPALMTANTIVGDGEDVYLLSFDAPVNAIGFDLLTNFMAQETVTLNDGLGTLIDIINIDALTVPNSRQFVGFASSIPIGSGMINTQDGARQNEGIDLLEVGGAASPIAEPSTLWLLGSAILPSLMHRWRASRSRRR